MAAKKIAIGLLFAGEEYRLVVVGGLDAAVARHMLFVAAHVLPSTFRWQRHADARPVSGNLRTLTDRMRKMTMAKI